MQPHDVNIRRAVQGDQHKLALVGGASFLETYAHMIAGDDLVAHCATRHAPGLYEEWLGDAASAIWLAETPPGSPVGYLVMTAPDLLGMPTFDSDLELRRIYVLSRFRGIGAALMAACIGEAVARGAGRLLLGVHRGNARALAFYAREGFLAVGERRFQVGGAWFDDLVLCRDLNERIVEARP